jgi:hypothetical protein
LFTSGTTGASSSAHQPPRRSCAADDQAHRLGAFTGRRIRGVGAAISHGSARACPARLALGGTVLSSTVRTSIASLPHRDRASMVIGCCRMIDRVVEEMRSAVARPRPSRSSVPCGPRQSDARGGNLARLRAPYWNTFGSTETGCTICRHPLRHRRAPSKPAKATNSLHLLSSSTRRKRGCTR